jgi:pimeloyl-ACP methyl ester carboxylesterase
MPNLMKIMHSGKRVLAGVLALITLVAVSGGAYQLISSHQELAGNPPPGQLIDIGGHRLHIFCTGTGAPAVILDNGLGGSFLGWGFVQPEVAKFARVCSFDRAGMGFSDAGPTPRTSVRIASELRALLDRTGIQEPVVLVGASFGGFDVRVFASQYQDRSAALVLVDASHEDQGARYAAAGVPEQGLWYARAVPLAAALGVMRIAGNSLEHEEELPAAMRRYAHIGRSTKAYRSVVDEYLHLGQTAAEVKTTRRKLNLPVIVLTAGQSDELPQARAAWQEMQRDQLALSDLSCQITEERAHHVMAIETPDVVVRTISLAVNAARSGGVKPAC